MSNSLTSIKDSIDDSKYLAVGVVAERLGLKGNSVTRLLTEGKLKFVKFGQMRYIPVEELKRYQKLRVCKQIDTKENQDEDEGRSN